MKKKTISHQQMLIKVQQKKIEEQGEVLINQSLKIKQQSENINKLKRGKQ